MQMSKVLALLALSFFSATAFSGFERPYPVEIEIDDVNGTGYAAGDLISARNSINEFEYIGCGVNSYDFGFGGSWTWGFCQAGLEEGNLVICTTENPALIETINGLSDSTYIRFQWADDGAGVLSGSFNCTRINASTNSFYLEEGKKTK